MYFNPPPQSPGLAHKLPAHHDQSPWSRSHHSVLSTSVAGPSVAPPPPSPGYAMYTNGNTMQHHPHPHPPQMHQHHHQNSLSHVVYPSPPNSHPHALGQGSPTSTSSQVITPQWQQQLLKYDISRSSRSPHHRARASAMASRTVAKSAIAITNPNAVKMDGSKDGDTASESSPDGRANGIGDTNHPSSTVAPIDEAPRLTAATPRDSTWNSLDMGGVNIKNIPSSSGLFSLTFLTNLFLNHNSLTSVPPEIAKLRHLTLLDLSGNNLMSVPPELGMLTMLKELYLFDNHLVTLPPELGTLHQLQTLGVEGNPLESVLKNIIQKDGTPALVSYLRDSCPVPAPPPERFWKQLVTKAERQAQEDDPTVETFSVLSYNILCERAATEQLYGYTPSWALTWEYRKELILTEVMNYDADFLCLQEVDIAQYEEYFMKQLTEHDYEGVYWPKSRYKTMGDAERRLVDGCATFYKASKYQLVEKQLVEYSAVAMQRPDFKKTDDMFNRVLGRSDIAVVTLFENKETGTRFIIANTHIHWNSHYSDVKLVQVALLIDEIEKIAANFARYPPPRPPSPGSPTTTRAPPTYSDGTKIPLIVAGDFNSVPTSGVYEFLSTGAVAPDHPDFMSHMYGNYTTEGPKHRLGLKSAYQGIGELPLTNYTPAFFGVLDYIWYSTNNLAVNSVLGEIDTGYLSKVVGFPNAHFPSDHVCIVCEFRVKPPKEAAPLRPPPVFPSSNGRS